MTSLHRDYDVIGLKLPAKLNSKLTFERREIESTVPADRRPEIPLRTAPSFTRAGGGGGGRATTRCKVRIIQPVRHVIALR